MTEWWGGEINNFSVWIKYGQRRQTDFLTEPGSHLVFLQTLTGSETVCFHKAFSTLNSVCVCVCLCVCVRAYVCARVCMCVCLCLDVNYSKS